MRYAKTPFLSLSVAPLTRRLANIAFLIRHEQNGFGKRIEPNDLSLATKSCASRATNDGVVGIGIFVHGNGFSNFVVRARVGRGEDVLEKFAEQVEVLLQKFFVGV